MQHMELQLTATVAKARYCGRRKQATLRTEPGADMRLSANVAAAIAAFLAVGAGLAALAAPANAATRKHYQPVEVARSASGTVIQPTTTIVPDGQGHVRVLVIPRRSYLETGTEVSVGDRSFHDYVLPPGGDPGHQNWFFGPDVQGRGSYPLPGPFDGINSNSPF
jgi:hypothetical protein